MEFVFLGTGAGVPSKQRNVSAVALHLLAERGTTWLFDCGEATQHQILHTSVKLGKIDKLFITHLHGDHIFGLPGFLGSRSFQGGDTPLSIYGPKGIKAFIETALAISKTHLRYELFIHEISEGIIYEDAQFIVSARLLDHVLPSFGYRIVEKDRPGRLDVERLKSLGVMPGPVYQQLKAGETVTLGDGRVLDGRDFLGPAKLGRRVAILGDTRPCNAALELARDVHVLVHEATFAADEEKLALDYYHSTTLHAADVAQRAGAEALILTHISSRYQDQSVDQLLLEAKEVFPNTYIAHDLWSYEV